MNRYCVENCNMFDIGSVLRKQNDTQKVRKIIMGFKPNRKSCRIVDPLSSRTAKFVLLWFRINSTTEKCVHIPLTIIVLGPNSILRTNFVQCNFELEELHELAILLMSIGIVMK